MLPLLTCLSICSLKWNREEWNIIKSCKMLVFFQTAGLCIWTPSITFVSREVYEPLTQRLNSVFLSLAFRALYGSAMNCNSHFILTIFLSWNPDSIHLIWISYIHITSVTASEQRFTTFGFFYLRIITCPNTAHHSRATWNSTSYENSF